MNYSHIELILAIADAGSISEAADNLFVSQPFLSSALKRIEDEIGTPLFTRSKSGAALTPFGHEYIQYARHIADQINSLNGLYKARQVPRLRLDVVSMGFCFLYPIFSIIREKYQKYPCVFQLGEASTSQQIQYINEGRYEVGLVVLDGAHRKQALRTIKAKGLDYFRLGSARSGVYVSKNSKLFPQNVNVLDRQTVKHLVGMPFISMHTAPEEMVAYEAWRDLFSLIKSQDRRFIASNTGMRTEMIQQYDGFGTASYCSALYEKYPFTENLRFVPFVPELDLNYELGWIQRQNQPRSTLANELFLMLSE